MSELFSFSSLDDIPAPKMVSGLSLTDKQFDELYPQLADYKWIFNTEAKNDEQMIEHFLSSKLWRLNNLYTIIDKHGNRIRFVMNYSQHRVYAETLKHPRLIILKSRQQGISTLWLLSMFDDAIFMEDLNVGLMAQGKEESATLLERVKLAWEALDDSIKDFLCVGLDKDNSTEYSFSNNSNIFIRMSFRSATLQRLHISELGKIANKYPKKAKETNTGTLQAIAPGNTVVIESTAEGNNMFKTKWDAAWSLVENNIEPAPKDFMPIFLSWLDDPDCNIDVPQAITRDQAKYFAELEDLLGITIRDTQKWFWVQQYRELGEDTYQEYPSTPEEAFSAVRDGTYFAANYNKIIVKQKRVIQGLYDHNLPVTVVMDLGMDDYFVLGFWQEHAGQERLIHEYVNTGEGLEHYVDYMKATPYNITLVVGPHDLRVRELGLGYSRKRRLHELGVRNIIVLKKTSVNDGIEAIRRMMPNLYIDESCEYIIKCFTNYSKEWDEIREVWKDKPFHDVNSHGMDMVRGRAMSNAKYRSLEGDGAMDKTTKASGKRTGVIDGLCM